MKITLSSFKRALFLRITICELLHNFFQPQITVQSLGLLHKQPFLDYNATRHHLFTTNLHLLPAAFFLFVMVFASRNYFGKFRFNYWSFIKTEVKKFNQVNIKLKQNCSCLQLILIWRHKLTVSYKKYFFSK